MVMEITKNAPVVRCMEVVGGKKIFLSLWVTDCAWVNSDTIWEANIEQHQSWNPPVTFHNGGSVLYPKPMNWQYTNPEVRKWCSCTTFMFSSCFGTRPIAYHICRHRPYTHCNFWLILGTAHRYTYLLYGYTAARQMLALLHVYLMPSTPLCCQIIRIKVNYHPFPINSRMPLCLSSGFPFLT